MVMELNVAHASFWEQKEYERTKIDKEEEDQDLVQEISIIQFIKQTGKKEEVEGGKSAERNHNNGDNVGKDI